MMKANKKVLTVIAAVLLLCMVTGAVLLTSVNTGSIPVVKVDFSNATSVFENFISRDGARLMDGGSEYRVVSVNAPTLLAVEDNYFHLPSNWEIDRAFQTFVQLGATAVRTYTLSIKKADDTNAQPKHIVGPNGELNEEAFIVMDNVLAAANKYGVRLIIPFVDQYSQYPNGGIGSFAALRGKTEDDFWTDEEVKDDYKALIGNVLNRVNTVTGIAYKDDKAVLAWETGNELRPVSHAWTNEMAAWIKSIDKNHLVVDGKYGIDDESLGDEYIDIVSNHYYPSAGNYVDAVMTDIGKASGKKPFIVGEFGFKKPDEIDEFLGAAIEGGASGVFLWSLRYPNEAGGFYPHSEGQFGDTFYAAYRWPGFSNGEGWNERETLNVLQRRAFEVRGMEIPAPSVPATPVLYPTKTVSAISWQESVGASSYEVQRREGRFGKWITIAENHEDSLTDPGIFADMTAADGKNYFYRVAARNSAGKSGYSNEIGPVRADHAIIDEIRSGGQFFMEWAKIYEKTQDLVFDRDNSVLYDWDRDRISQRSVASEQFVCYATPTDIDSFAFTTYIKPEDAASRFRIMVSADDSVYVEIEADVDETPGKDGSMTVVRYTNNKVPAGYRFIRIVFPAVVSAELGKSVVGYVNKNGVELAMPAGKGKQLMINGILKDDLNDDAKIIERSPNFGFETSNPEFFEGDDSRLCRNQNTAEYITYQSEGDMNYVKVTAYARQETIRYKVGDFVISASPDGETYTDVTAVIDRKAGEGWWERQEYTVYALPDGTKYLRITYPVLPDAGAADTWNPQIGNIEIGIGDYELEVPVKAEKTTMIEDFESYRGLDSKLLKACTLNGDPLKLSLNGMIVTSGASSLAFEPTIGSNGYSGFDKDIGGMDLSGTAGMKLMVNPKGSSMNLTIQFTDTEGEPWKADFTVGGDGWQEVAIPFSQFYVPGWYSGGNKKMELDKVGTYGLYSSTNGKIYIDDVQVYKSTEIDTFDSYADDAALNGQYKANADGDSITIALDKEHISEGVNSLRLTCNLTDDKGYAGIVKEFNPLDWTGRTGIQAWISSEGAGNGVCIQIRESSGEYWESKFTVSSDESATVTVPFNSFVKPGWNKSAGDGALDLSAVDLFAIYLDKGIGSAGENTVYFDSIKLIATNDIESFEYYQGSDANLQEAYRAHESGDAVSVSLDAAGNIEGKYALKYSYNLDANGWGGVAKTLQATSFAGGNSLEFQVNPDGKNRGLSVQFTDADGDIWKARTILSGSGYRKISIPFGEFTRTEFSKGIGSMDLSAITDLGLYVDLGSGEKGSGEIYIDDIRTAVNPVLDDADFYADPSKDLTANKSYVINKDGNKLTVIPEGSVCNSGPYALKITYTLDDKINFAGATKFFGSPIDYSVYDGIQYWVKPDGSGNRLVLQVKESGGEPFDASYKLAGTEPVLVRIPWHAFKKPGWYSGAGNGVLNPDDISEFSIYVNMGDSGPITSTLVLDSIQAARFDLLDGFENYYFDDSLQAAYMRNKDGGKVTVKLDTAVKNEGGAAMKLDYDFAGKGWAGAELAILPDDWSGYEGIELWVKPDGGKQGLSVQIYEDDGESWKYPVQMDDGSDGRIVRIPFANLAVAGDWARKDGILDLSSIVRMGLYLDMGSGDRDKGTVYFDSIRLY